MITSVSLQYAKAVFDLAKEKGLVDDFAVYLEISKKLFIDDHNIYSTFNHPAISIDEKKVMLDSCLKDYVDNTFLNYLKVLVDNNRLNELNDILESFKLLQNDYHNRCDATIYTKYELSEEEKNRIKESLIKKYNKDINLNIVIDQTIVAGIRIVIDDHIIDATIKSEMLDLKKELVKGW